MAGKSKVYSQIPEMPDLQRFVVDRIPTRWMDIGIQLKIEISKLKMFEQQYGTNLNRLWIEVIEQWRKEQKVLFTWYTIINAIEDLGERQTASKIKFWLNQSTTV